MTDVKPTRQVVRFDALDAPPAKPVSRYWKLLAAPFLITGEARARGTSCLPCARCVRCGAQL